MARGSLHHDAAVVVVELDASLADGPHALLRRMTGTWKGRARLWLAPGALHTEDEVEGKIEPACGERLVTHAYSTRIDDAEHTGLAMIGFELSSGRWQVAWLDSFHTGTGIMFSQGPRESSEAITVLGSYEAGEGPPWGWRTTYEPSDDRLLVRHFNITPDGEEALAVEFDYARG